MIRQAVLLVFWMCLSATGAVSMIVDTVPQVNEIFYPTIHPDATTQFSITNFPTNTSYLVFQLHAYDEKLSLSLTPTFDPGSVVTGRDIGVVSKVQSGDTSVAWYVRSNGTKSASAFSVLGLASSHTHRQPLVGGCNMEFPLNIDPNLHIDHVHSSNLASFQYSQEVTVMNGSVESCDVRHQKNLRYALYQQYVGGSGSKRYFDAITHMLLVNGIAENGYKAKTFNYSDKTQERFASFAGKGVVYNVVVHDVGAQTSVAYVPVVSYGCDNNDDVGCAVLVVDHAFGILLSVTLGLTGIFICFLGHRFFRTEMFVFGFLGTVLLCYILFLRYSSESQPVSLALGAACGVAGGLLWLAFWYFLGMPLFSILYVGLVSGYLVSSVVFNLTPLKDIIWWQEPLNYGLSFACGILIVPVLLLAFPHTLNLLSCSVVGGYLAVVMIDIFVKGNVSQIILLSINKSVWNEFLKAKVILPYQWTDLLLIILWGLLTVGGAIFQHIRERNRAPFPPCPWKLRRRNQERLQWEEDFPTGNIRDSTNTSPDTGSDNERTPLLIARSIVLNVS